MGLTVSCNCTKHQIMPNHSTKSTHSIHRTQLAARLQEAIRRKRVTVREVKVRKPVELHLRAEDECAICLDPLSKKNIAVTPCGHKFCFTCIAENLNVSKTCPMCRERIAPDAKKKRSPTAISKISFIRTLKRLLTLSVGRLLSLRSHQIPLLQTGRRDPLPLLMGKWKPSVSDGIWRMMPVRHFSITRAQVPHQVVSRHQIQIQIQTTLRVITGGCRRTWFSKSSHASI